jgi:signal recognition particle subunit SRP54
VFEELIQKFDRVVRNLRGTGKLTEKNMEDSMREIRRVLLDADVHFKVAKDFVSAVRARALGQDVTASVTPGQMVVKIVHDELVHLLGGAMIPLRFHPATQTVVMLVGLQGSGKTTFAAKLGVYLKKHGHYPLLAACDMVRPAAVDQLVVLGKSADVPVFTLPGAGPVQIADQALSFARSKNLDVVVLDTAGRLHIDDAMMSELEEIKKTVKPADILFVADGMTGQDAVKSAQRFKERIDFDGVALTKMDGDARGGAALSIRAVTGKPIQFVSTGEKLQALEPFHPERMASRILGMGDVVSLVEKAQEAVDLEESKKLAEKIAKRAFDLEDFLDQLQQVKKMGPMDQLLGMIPGAGAKLSGLKVDESSFSRIEAIIRSMTVEERRRPNVINGSRRKRIAAGSGTSVQDVNRLLKQFQGMQTMMKRMGRMGPKKLSKMGFGF